MKIVRIALLLLLSFALAGTQAKLMSLMGKDLESFLDAMISYGDLTPLQKDRILDLTGDLVEDVVFDARNGVSAQFQKEEARAYILSQTQAGLLSEDAASYLTVLLELQEDDVASKELRVAAGNGYSGSGYATSRNGANGNVEFLGRIAPKYTVGELYNGVWGYATGSREYALFCDATQFHVSQVNQCRYEVPIIDDTHHFHVPFLPKDH